jgi:hypothetical protein
MKPDREGRGKNGARPVRFSVQDQNFATRFHVPEDDTAIAQARGQAAAIGRETDGPRRQLVASQSRDLLPSLQIEQLAGIVETGRG